MKRIFAIVFLCALLFSATPALGKQSNPKSQDLPTVLEDVVKNRDFFARPWVLWGHEHCSLNGAERLNDDRIGVVLLTPSGFEYRLVYDLETMETVYEDMRIPEKRKREAMKRKSIRVTDAMKLAGSAVSYTQKTK